MHIHWLDQYQPGLSPVHRLDARVKLSLVLAYILAASLMPVGAWPAFSLLFFYVLALTLVSGLGLLRVQRRALVALPFALAAVTIVFTTEGPLAFALSLGPWRLRATEPGLVRFFSIMLKGWLSVQMAVLLAGTTPFPTLLMAMRSLRFPPVLVAINSFMWRYVFVLADEAMRLSRARDARSGVRSGLKSGGPVSWRAKVVGGMVGNLFIRSYERSERVFQAMAARGYRGEFHAFSSPALPTRDVWLGMVLAVYLVAVLLVGIVFQ
jgi:cobalt/nickel transport system permease protein